MRFVGSYRVSRLAPRQALEWGVGEIGDPRVRKILRPLLTVLLGLLLAFDAVIGYRLWHYGLPHEFILESAGSGAERVIVKRVPFTVLDGLFLGLFAALHLGLFYLARRSWKPARAR